MDPKRIIPIILFILSLAAGATATETASTIESVILYQNKGMVTRKTSLHLEKGLNTIIIPGLSPALYDWSLRIGPAVTFKGTVNSIEVVKKALTQQREERIRKIESSLAALQDQDRVLIDEMKAVKGQISFLDSVMDFTKMNAAKDMTAGAVNVSSWDGTLQYVRTRMKDLLKEQRTIEKERENIGKEIQKWEYELFQAAGQAYYSKFVSMNKTLHGNSTILAGQQFDKGLHEFADLNKLLTNPGNIDFEKQVAVEIYSPTDGTVDFSIEYIVPGTSWDMKYDIRASEKNASLAMSIFGDITQSTGEDWKEVRFSLSTGQPAHTFAFPVPDKWFLDVAANLWKSGLQQVYGGATSQLYASETSIMHDKKAEEQQDDADQETLEYVEKGMNIEISLPQKQSIPSDNQRHKKTIGNVVLNGTGATGTATGGLRFFYELVPAKDDEGYLKIAVTNNSPFPWLQGEAQIFLEGQFMGKTTIPFTPQGAEREILLGREKRISGTKELVKKFEDNAGLFNGRRRIRYTYALTVKNDCVAEKEVILHDTIPVSKNEKIDVAVENITHPFDKGTELEKTSSYLQGERTWHLTLAPHQKLEIGYDVIVSFDKDVNVKGLH